MKHICISFLIASSCLLISSSGCDQLFGLAADEVVPEGRKRFSDGKRFNAGARDLPPAAVKVRHARMVRAKLKEHGFVASVRVKDQDKNGKDDFVIEWTEGRENGTLGDILVVVGEVVAEGGEWGDCVEKKDGGMGLIHWPEDKVYVNEDFWTNIRDTYNGAHADVKKAWAAGVKPESFSRKMTEICPIEKAPRKPIGKFLPDPK